MSHFVLEYSDEPQHDRCRNGLQGVAWRDHQKHGHPLTGVRDRNRDHGESFKAGCRDLRSADQLLRADLRTGKKDRNERWSLRALVYCSIQLALQTERFISRDSKI